MIVLSRLISKVKINLNPSKSVDEAVRILIKTVKITLGPQGNNVIIQNQKDSKPWSTKDGVTVVKNISLTNPQQQMCAYLIRNSANQANKQSGDGTTTTTILTGSLIHYGKIALSSGLPIHQLKTGFELFQNQAVQYLRLKSKPITKAYQYSQVANISTNGNRQISSLVVGACMKSDFSSNIKIEQAQGSYSQLVVQNCFSIMRAPEVRFYQQKQKMVLQNPYILIMEQQINDMRQISDLLGQIKSRNKQLVIFAPNFNKPVMDTLYFNHTRNIIKIMPITLQGTHQFIQQQLLDLSILFNSPKYKQKDLSLIVIQQLGHAKYVHADKFQTSIYANYHNSKQYLQHLSYLKQLQSTPFIKERLDRLQTTRVKILVGGQNNLQFKENRDKVVDSLNALLKAKAGGILPGGGVALLKLSQLLKLIPFPDNRIQQIIRQSIYTPFYMLCNNVGQKKKMQVLRGDFNTGIDLRSGEVCNMIDRGIVQACQTVTSNLRISLRSAFNVLSVRGIISKLQRESLPEYKNVKDKYSQM